jgi:outer membrane protein TolC
MPLPGNLARLRPFATTQARALAVALALAAAPVIAQDAAPKTEAITLDQVLAEASSAGADFKIVDQTLAVARSQRSLDLAKQGFVLSTNGGYSLADGLGKSSTSVEQTLVARAESAAGASATSSSTGFAQSGQAGLSLSAPLTKVSLSASHSIPPPAASGAKATSANDQASVFGLTASQTLWDGYPGGQYLGTLEKSRLTLQGKELAAATGRSAAVAKAKQAYVAMLAAQRDLDIKRQVLDKQRKLLAQVEAVFALKQASQIDMETARINAASAELDVATADKAQRLANQRLAVIMGRPADSRFAVADVPQPPLPAASVDDAIAAGLAKRVDLAQYRIAAASARIDADLARAQAQPGVTLSGGAGLAASWASPPVMEEALSLGAKITFPIIDAGTAAFQAGASLGQAKLADIQAQQLSQSAANDIQDYYETAQLLLAKIDLAKRGADLSVAQFELVKLQNDHGTATVQDLLTASVNAATAEVAYGAAKNNYLLAELQLETAMGL